MTKIKKIYNSLDRKSQIVIKCTFALAIPLLTISLMTNLPYFTPYHYELLIISDELSETARSILSTGLIGAVILNYLEKAHF